jgi:cytochrome c oxidase cbb3-type subunit 3
MTLISKTAACLTAMFLLAAGVTNLAGAEPALDTNKCVPPLEGIRGDADNGQDLHLENCAECHGYDGKAEVIVMHMDEPPRDQTDVEYMTTLNDAFLYLAICSGGEAVGRSLVMPFWGDVLSDQEIRDLVAWVRTFSGT